MCKLPTATKSSFMRQIYGSEQLVCRLLGLSGTFPLNRQIVNWCQMPLLGVPFRGPPVSQKTTLPNPSFQISQYDLPSNGGSDAFFVGGEKVIVSRGSPREDAGKLVTGRDGRLSEGSPNVDYIGRSPRRDRLRADMRFPEAGSTCAAAAREVLSLRSGHGIRLYQVDATSPECQREVGRKGGIKNSTPSGPWREPWISR
jgi:hypothetical protein